MTNINKKQRKVTSTKFDLEDRTLEFGKKIIRFCKKVPKNTVTIPLVNQCVRSGTSTGANYIEANEALSKRDFTNRIRIARKEVKECRYWLYLIMTSSTPLEAWSPIPTLSGRPPEEDDISAFNSPTGLKPMVLLNAVIEAWPQGKKEAEQLAQEAKEYLLIFSQIIKNTTGKSRF